MEKYRIDENKKLKGKFALASLTTCSKDFESDVHKTGL